MNNDQLLTLEYPHFPIDEKVNVPHIIKYMGSKRKILNFIIENLEKEYSGGRICDLFAGTSILSGALGRSVPMHSNDIQEYSAILAKTYLSNYNWDLYPTNILEIVVAKANQYVVMVKEIYPNLEFAYSDKLSLKAFSDLEVKQQNLIDYNFELVSHFLFVKFYSGTYWSFEQCLWIDAFRYVADEYIDTPLYFVILSSLMYAMSYNSQSTGHFAQYRDPLKVSSKNDILLYRLKTIVPLFEAKFNQLRMFLGPNPLKHLSTTLGFESCLNLIENNSLIYADPPYAFVHYSRFYHALETLVKYDYPKVSHKGRYRMERHQSPFCKRSEVKGAFQSMFTEVKKKDSTLVLSYSNTGMITLDEIKQISGTALGSKYVTEIKECNHVHSTMGRSEDKSRDVKEYLIISRPK